MSEVWPILLSPTSSYVFCAVTLPRWTLRSDLLCRYFCNINPQSTSIHAPRTTVTHLIRPVSSVGAGGVSHYSERSQFRVGPSRLIDYSPDSEPTEWFPGRSTDGAHYQNKRSTGARRRSVRRRRSVAEAVDRSSHLAAMRDGK